jgi:hypothetical protein
MHSSWRLGHAGRPADHLSRSSARASGRMVFHAFYAAWDEAVKAGAKPSEGQYRKMIEQEEKAKHKALNGGKAQLDAMLKELNGDQKLDDEQAKKLEEILAVLGEEAIEGSKHHHHHHSGPMPLLSTPTIVQKWEDKEYPEVHIGWADIYLDLILVGVAFNGGLMLKHAFYLCHPHDAAHGAAEHHRSMFERVETHSHPTCVGLGMGVLHVLAFGVPILGAWLKETMFRARFEAHNLVARSLEVMCYLLMIIGASCEEDVTILQEDRTFWQMFTTCMRARRGSNTLVLERRCLTPPSPRCAGSSSTSRGWGGTCRWPIGTPTQSGGWRASSASSCCRPVRCCSS